MRSVALVALLSVLACAPTYNVETTYDRFEDQTITRMSGNMVGPAQLLRGQVTLDAGRLEQADTVSYALIVGWKHDDWLFIERGESLVLLVDGERMAFVGSGSAGDRDVGGCYEGSCSVYETSVYPVTPDDLRAIAQANSIAVRVIGQEGYVEREFTPENVQRFQEFVSLHVPAGTH